MTKTPIRNNLTLELHVPSFEPARQFYGLFGFTELDYDAPTDDPSGGYGYLVLVRRDSLGDTLLNFYGDKESVWQHPHFEKYPHDTPRSYAVEITIPASDIQKLWREVATKLDPASISQPLELKNWGTYDFRLVDPYGFYVRFTELVDWGQKKLA